VGAEIIGENLFAFRLSGSIAQENGLGRYRHPFSRLVQNVGQGGQCFPSLVAESPAGLRSEHQRYTRGLAQIDHGKTDGTGEGRVGRYETGLREQARKSDAMALRRRFALTPRGMSCRHIYFLKIATDLPIAHPFWALPTTVSARNAGFIR